MKQELERILRNMSIITAQVLTGENFMNVLTSPEEGLDAIALLQKCTLIDVETPRWVNKIRCPPFKQADINL